MNNRISMYAYAVFQFTQLIKKYYLSYTLQARKGGLFVDVLREINLNIQFGMCL